MVRAFFALACISSAVLAAPAPPPGEKELIARLWGSTEGQGQFGLKGKQLTIRTVLVPDSGMIGIIGNSPVTMPRVTRTVSGDFEAAVKVVDAAMPKREAKHSGSWPNSRAGLFVEGGGYAIEFHLLQYHLKDADEPNRCIWVDAWSPGRGSGSTLDDAKPGHSTHLRVARKGKAITVSSSFDGKTWSDPHSPGEIAFPDEVTVGTFFSHSTYQILDATFDCFTIEKPKAHKD